MAWRAIALSAAWALAACSTTPDDSVAAPPSEAAARGLAYAQQTCGGCHAVMAGQEVSPDPNAPSFTVIANTPGMTSTALNVWLHSAHASMPNLIVAPGDRDDVAAYLDSIRRGGAAG